MDSKAAELLAALKNVNLSIDAKIAHLSTIKSDIKQKNVPESAVSSLFESLRLALVSQHSSLFSAGFSTLGHFLKRLFIQSQSHLVSQYGRVLYPILLDRLGDRKERTRAQAAQAFTDLWTAASGDVEHYVLEIALVGKNPRAKEMSMIWLGNMTKSHGLLFRAYVPSLVACLEDADSAVRDTAKMTVVELFQNAPARAKSDLTKQLSVHNVRKSISNAILASIGLSSTEPEHPAPPRPASRGDGLLQRPVSVMSSRSHHHEPLEDMEPPKPQRPISRVGERSIGPAQIAPDELPEEGYSPRADPESVEPLIVASARDVDDMVRDMLPYFDGRESEENWVMRERNTVTLRRLTRGNAPQSFPTQYLSGIKTLLDGIFKVVNSLRTTLCTAGCLLIQDIARTCGPKVDSMVEIMLQNLIKLCCGMKKISAQSGSTTLDTVISNVTFTSRILQHVTSAAQDRNTQLRLYAAGWIKTIVSRQARFRSTMEHAGGLDNLDKSIRKGLGDANPGVRETMRKTFWTFSQVWPGKANDIMSTLDAKSRSLLEKDPSNPNTGESAAKTPTASSRKGLASSTSAASSRSALKDAIAAQKRAHLSPEKPLPQRPESAQSTFGDVKPLELPSKSSSSTTGTTTTTRTIPTGSHVSSLSSAPMRPAMKPRRPELGRPATADPYARRSGTEEPRSRGTTPKVDNSPKTVKTKPTATPSSKSVGGATRPRQKTDPGHPGHMGSTMSKPKKLDISKSRLNEHSATHSRNGSHDSATQRPGRDSPAPIQLESPPGSMIQQSAPAVEEPLTLPPPPQQMSSVERRTPEPPQEEAAAELDDIPLPSPDMVANNARKQPAPVHIYEDPVPTSAEPAVSAPAPAPAAEPADTEAADDRFISADTLARDDQLKAEGYDLSPGLEDPPAVATEVEAASPEQESHMDVAAPSVEPTDIPIETEEEATLDEAPANGLDTATGAGTTDVENNNQPEVEAPASPAGSVVHHPATTEGENEPSSTPAGVLSESPHGNNENTTPAPSKFVNVSSENRPTPRSNVLEEIPNNEPVQRDNKPPRQAVGKRRSSESLPAATPDVPNRRWKKFESERRRSLSPRSKDPAKAREMLDKGVHRIQTKTMDILGYRKLQGLIGSHEAIFETEAKYDEMLTALLDELESVPEEKRQSIGRPMDLKTQVLVTIRFMFRHNPQYFAAYHAQAVTALVSARKRYPSSSHIASGLEETAEDIIAVCDAGTVIDAILDQVEVEDKDEEGYRAITMGTNVMSRLVRRVNSSSSSSSDKLDERLVERIGQFSGPHLTDRQPDVRRQVTDLSVALYRTVGDERRFWEVLGSPRENSRNLLTYYIHKK